MVEPEPDTIRVLIWDEQQPEQTLGYGGKFLGETIAAHLNSLNGISAFVTTIDDPCQGLSPELLDAADVILWWGHRRHKEVETERVEEVVQRILAGRLAGIFLHSAHFSRPFMRLMDERAMTDAPFMVPKEERENAVLELRNPTERGFAMPGGEFSPSVKKIDDKWQLVLPSCCFPAWRVDGQPSHVTTLMPEHPIANGVPFEWVIPQTEMYQDPFHVPKPDATVFEERWAAGETFRSGCLWRVGEGRVFYFRPGHETYPVFLQKEPLRVIENAVRFLG